MVEILVVVTIISMLASIAAVSYSQFIKQSRDARRKTDVEQIRAAIELYRNFNSIYPATAAVTFGSGAIADGTSTYMRKVPTDPLVNYTYNYNSVSPFLDYQLCAYLEGGSTISISPPSCGAINCNYCMGPYGQL